MPGSRVGRPLVRPVTEDAAALPAVGLEEGTEAVRALLGPRLVAITGAGISTESGIPDYRGPTGRARNATPMTYDEFVSSAEAQRRYWARSFAGWPVMGAALPNVGHRALATLQRAGSLAGVITQNVDRLHQRVGTDPLLELHGSLDRVVCLACGALDEREPVQARLAEANPQFDPTRYQVGDDAGGVQPDGDIEVLEAMVAGFQTVPCSVCGNGPLKPDVVFFGESVPRHRVELATTWTQECSALLVLGSSLAVMSAYRFVRAAHAAGRRIVIVNDGPTRGDAQASVRVQAPLGRLLSALLS
jgi:NAD-dependent SIR2 family protein deacetylase